MANETILFILCPGDSHIKMMSFMFEIALRRQGHKFTRLVAENVAEGLQLTELQHIDLIFVIDGTLDQVNYKEIIKAFRTNPLTSHLPIMLYKITLSESDAQEIGVDAYCTMPFPLNDLGSMVENFLTSWKSSSSVSDKTSYPIHNIKGNRHPSILIIENNLSQAIFYKTLFEAAEYEIIMAHSGESGLNIAQTQPIDMIILDDLFPEMRDREFIQKLRSERPIPIILLSYRGAKIVHAADSAFLYVVTPPIHPGQLIRLSQSIIKWIKS